MNKNMRKLIAVFVVFIQLSMPAFSSFGAGSPASAPGEETASVQQVDGISAVFVIINSNISQQMRRLVDLACLAASLAHTPKPISHENTRNTGADGSVSPSIVISNSFSADNSVKNFAPGNDIDGRMLVSIVLLCALFAAVFFTGLMKWKRFFYLLPRGSIDDIIINFNSMGKTLIELNPMRVFLLPAEDNKSLYPGGSYVPRKQVR
ncbi:MAG TPA: hypothetical protein DEE98_05020 [Elusimicrobia bacterium]|nr:MAG: hypothetical protein A2278_04695 [Elusimicrobia bacterium RIFOXYA12_FULL_49_49]OGS06057.1 MAG: hypothetical protein A2204_04115 [Elusimicrobia bacterium RIFOXYA1_FULL_47_7]OGS11686.1 MAG: hypothetical protein A2386_06605 [Elusimicrobia bacterium RIFOXYB1_FULL_48_9]OGS14655.1 MAG: hypothetical protein A2251_09145 [Elusimicrobia bacterium RIFOXYA2_FULL_47_53]OGS25692.1 MAG: hypothetical protein A2339_06445 [Elusimicrobia bacterium RIFOXYB12_FULL_50_12]OGS31746.1 MAG: hypothetical protein